jgi:Outer membrane lipoprotein-sorting protein
MRSRYTRIVLAVSMLAVARLSPAQTADEIIEKTLAAAGGRAALAKLTSRTTTGKITISSDAGELPGTIEILNEAPNKVRTLINLDLTSLGAGAITIDQRFDGTSGYTLDSMRGNSEVTGGRLESLRNGAFPSPFLTYKERGTRIVVAGKEKVGDRDAFVLSITPSNGPALRTWIDAESYLPLKAATTIDTPETGPLEQISEFSDYREVDGVKVAFLIKNTTAVQSAVIRVTKIEHNTKIDPALFSKPAGE